MAEFFARERLVLTDKETDWGEVIVLSFDVISEQIPGDRKRAPVRIKITQEVDGALCGWFDELAQALEVGDEVPLKLIFGP